MVGWYQHTAPTHSFGSQMFTVRNVFFFLSDSAASFLNRLMVGWIQLSCLLLAFFYCLKNILLRLMSLQFSFVAFSPGSSVCEKFFLRKGAIRECISPWWHYTANRIRFIYSQKWNCAALFPIFTFLYLWDIPTIGPPIFCSKIGSWELGMRSRNFISGNICFAFLVQCFCSVVLNGLIFLCPLFCLISSIW
jgi:hypothetical protein